VYTYYLQRWTFGCHRAPLRGSICRPEQWPSRGAQLLPGLAHYSACKSVAGVPAETFRKEAANHIYWQPDHHSESVRMHHTRQQSHDLHGRTSAVVQLCRAAGWALCHRWKSELQKSFQSLKSSISHRNLRRKCLWQDHSGWKNHREPGRSLGDALIHGLLLQGEGIVEVINKEPEIMVLLMSFRSWMRSSMNRPWSTNTTLITRMPLTSSCCWMCLPNWRKDERWRFLYTILWHMAGRAKRKPCTEPMWSSSRASLPSTVLRYLNCWTWRSLWTQIRIFAWPGG